MAPVLKIEQRDRNTMQQIFNFEKIQELGVQGVHLVNSVALRIWTCFLRSRQDFLKKAFLILMILCLKIL